MNGAYSWRDVDRLDFTHEFQGINTQKLWLRSILRTGYSADGNSPLQMPLVYLDSHNAMLRNNYPSPSLIPPPPVQYPETFLPRIGHIWDGYSQSTVVTYTQPHPCNGVIADESNNYTDCWKAKSGAIFNKWLVSTVEQRDRVTLGNSVVTTYVYNDLPRWKWTQDPAIFGNQRGWNEWRGHGTVDVFTGTGVARQHKRFRYFRGMSRNGEPPGTGAVENVTDLAGANPVEDLDDMAGKIYDTYILNNGNLVSSARTEYLAFSDQASIDYPGWPVWRARMVLPRIEHTTTPFSGGGQRTTRKELWFYSDTGFGSYEIYLGDIAVSGDEYCDVTQQTLNSTKWLSVPSVKARYADSSCTTGARWTYFYYDGIPTWNAAPTKGNLTQRQTYTNPGTYSVETMTVDVYGRTTTVTDPRNVKSTSTTFTPINWIPHQIATSVFRTSNGTSLNMTKVVNLTGPRGLPSSETNERGKVTSLEYDQLGRLLKVFKPGDGPDASLVFAYTIPSASDYTINATRSPVVVWTSRRLTGATYTTSTELYDGLQRVRESRSYSTLGGNLLVRSEFDDAGRLTEKSRPVYTSTAWLNLLAGPVVGPETKFTYDGAGRVIASTDFGATGAALRTTNTTHNVGGINRTVTPPQGAATRTWIDGRGRTTRSDVLKQVPTPSTATTMFVYGPFDELLRITDPGGNQTNMTYDWASRRRTLVHPEQGASSFTYDENNNLTAKTDAKGDTITYVYDELDRLTTQKDGGITLASWTFHATGQGTQNSQLPATATRIVAGSSYTMNFSSYDERGRLTTKSFAIPAAEGALAGNYAYTYSYDASDNLVSTVYPGAGGLASETVTGTWNATNGMPYSLNSPLESYVNYTTFQANGKVQAQVLGPPTPSSTVVVRWQDHDPDLQRLQLAYLSVGGAAMYHLRYTYDLNDNIVATDETPWDERWCYSYDEVNRLTRAWTTRIGTTPTAQCSDFNAPALPPASPAYKAEWTFTTGANDIDNMLSFAEYLDGATAPVTKSYTYNPAKPHQVSSITKTGLDTDSFVYDANGAQTSRTINGTTSTLNWDKLQRLTSASATNNKLRSKATNTCLTPPGTVAGSVYGVATCSTSTNQQFEARTTRGGVQLINRDPANGKCMEVSLGIGPNVIQNNCDGTASATINGQSPGNVAGTSRQLWNLVMVTPGNSANGYTIRNSATNQCLRVVSGASQSAVCNAASSDQVWYLDGVASQTTNVYDANGNRLIRTDANGNKILTLDDTDLVLANGAVSATRYYRLAGDLVALRTPAGRQWIATDHQGTITTSLSSVAPLTYRRQRYTPYGAPLGSLNNLQPPSQRGFLGSTEDDALGLVMLGVRLFDPVMASFVSVDPVSSEPPYAYGRFSPLNWSDVSGTRPCRDSGDGCGPSAPRQVRPPKEEQRPIPNPRHGNYDDPLPTGLARRSGDPMAYVKDVQANRR